MARHLAWMVEGCLDWQRQASTPPEAVRSATDAYLEAEERVTGLGLMSAADRDPQAWEKSSDLFASWSAWATAIGRDVGSLKRFAQSLEARGFTPQRRRNGRGFFGLRVVRRRPLGGPRWRGVTHVTGVRL